MFVRIVVNSTQRLWAYTTLACVVFSTGGDPSMPFLDDATDRLELA